MRRTEVLQGIRQMKFEEVLGRTKRRQLTQEEAASMLGLSERTFRRWRDRFAAEGAQAIGLETELEDAFLARLLVRCQPGSDLPLTDAPEGFCW